MNTNHLISKKDLLAVMGIYGQLFTLETPAVDSGGVVHQTIAYTGQETFFPREQILSRIQSILELKDKYSLDELARLLSPGTSDARNFHAESSKILPRSTKSFLGGLPKDRKYTYPELGFLSALSALPLSGKERAVLAQKGLDYRGIRDARACVVFSAGGEDCLAFSDAAGGIAFRQKRTCPRDFTSDEEAARLKMKYENKGNERI